MRASRCCFIRCLYALRRGSFISLLCVPRCCEAAGLQALPAWNIFFSTFQFPPSERLFAPHPGRGNAAAGVFLSRRSRSHPHAPFSLMLIIVVLISLRYALLCNYPPPLSPLQHMITCNEPVISPAASSRAHLVQQIGDHSPGHLKPFFSHEKAPLSCAR